SVLLGAALARPDTPAGETPTSGRAATHSHPASLGPARFDFRASLDDPSRNYGGSGAKARYRLRHRRFHHEPAGLPRRTLRASFAAALGIRADFRGPREPRRRP